MGGIDGIETAERIRTMGKSSLIIFISSYDEKLRELFAYGTIAFLDKPLKTEQLEIELKKAFNIIRKDKEKMFSYKKNGSTYYIPINEIIYFEAMLNHVMLYTVNGKIQYNDLFKNVWGTLKENINFIRPNRSHIYNLKYATLKSNTVILKNSYDIQNIGRNYKDETYSRFCKYMEMRSE